MSLARFFHKMTPITSKSYKHLFSFQQLDLIPTVNIPFGWSVLFLFSSSLLPYSDDLIFLLPQEAWMDEVSGGTKVFQSYNRTFISIPAWELVVVPVGSGSGGMRIHVSLSNQGGLLESSKVT
jgi:hypothetical protein